MLRLAPERRAAALAEAASLEGEFGEALRYALGGNVDAIGASEVLWVAAARARAPFADDERVEQRHPRLGPDAGLAAQYRIRYGADSNVRGMFNTRQSIVHRVPGWPLSGPQNIATVALHYEATYGHSAGMHRWLGTVWPLARESFFAQGIERIVGRDSGQIDLLANRPFLEALLDPDTPLERLGAVLLVGALSAKHAEQSLLATDALIAAIDDGRLDAGLLGKTLAFLLPSGLLKPIRIANSLGVVARLSLLHAYIVCHALQLGLCCAKKMIWGHVTWTGLGNLLRLLKELLIETGDSIHVEELRLVLSGLGASGSTAAIIREILSIEARDGRSTLKDATLYALNRRIERVGRWNRQAEKAVGQ